MDRSLRILRGEPDKPSDKPFGGITLVLSGDWRQCLPVVWDLVLVLIFLFCFENETRKKTGNKKKFMEI